MAIKENKPTCARPSGGIDECPSDIGCNEGINAALSFFSASEKKIGLFDKDKRSCGEVCGATVLCDTLLLTPLVAGDVCLVCGNKQLAVSGASRKAQGTCVAPRTSL